MDKNASDSPSTGAAPHGPTGTWRGALTMVMVTVLVILVGAASCADRATPKETVDSLRAKSPTLKGKLRLRIGVREDVPYMFFREPNGVRSGFEIDIAKELARELGYDETRIDWVPIRTLPERLSVLQQNRADIVLANFSMTKAREEFVEFAGPYQLVPQAVLVRRDRTKPLETIAALRASGVRICTTTGSTSENALREKLITAEPVDTNADCMDGMRDGTYDAFSTDLPILAALMEEDRGRSGKETFEILELAIADSDERIGVAVPKGDRPLRDLVAYFLDRWQRAGAGSPWLRAYDRTIGRLLDPRFRSQPRVENPPDLADFDSKAPRT